MGLLFLDSADLSEIDEIIDSRFIGGVTTNPSLVSKTKKREYDDLISDIACRLNESKQVKHLSVEVLSLEPNEMIKEAIHLHEVVRNNSIKNVDLFIKIPVSLKYLRVITELNKKNINVNATACMIYSQAYAAECSGARIVSFFYNRMKDAGLSIEKELAALSNIDPHHDVEVAYGCLSIPYRAKVICGSIRRPEDISNCWNAGAHIVTASYKIIDMFLYHHKTEEAINGFKKDIEEWQR